MYFLSLYGGWTMVAEKLGGGGKRQYEYLEKKLFNIYLDDYFLLTLMIFALFIIVVELSVLIFTNNINVQGKNLRHPLQVSHAMILSVSSIAGFISYLIIREGLYTSVALNIPPYELMKRGLGEVPPYFTIHQLMNRMAIIPAMLGFTIFCSGKNPRLIAGRGNRWLGFGYLLVIGGMVGLSFLLGYKSDIFLPIVGGILFYLVNAETPRIKIVVFMSIAGIILMGLIDLLRYVSIVDLKETIGNLNYDDMLLVFQFGSTNNEKYAAYFSMYGILSQDISLTYGSSVLSLAASVVPRALWIGRPDDIYTYFADSVYAVEGQGYTIHHAAGCYLNFGIVGVLLGGFFMGWIWAKFYNSFTNTRIRKYRFQHIFSSLAPWMFVAYLHAIMRAGPEVYKGLFVEVLFFPVIVLTFASYRWNIFFPSKIKHTYFKR
jgi:hypothetical protein